MRFSRHARQRTLRKAAWPDCSMERSGSRPPDERDEGHIETDPSTILEVSVPGM